MAQIKTFPEVIFVTVMEDRDSEWLSANLTKRDALDEGGQKIVGLYKFMEAQDVREGPTVSKKLKNRRTK